MGKRNSFGDYDFAGILRVAVFVLLLCWVSGIISATSIYAQEKDGSRRNGPQFLESQVPSTGAAPRTKIAEGEYAIIEQGNSGAYGPFGEEMYAFRESWTLWRADHGQYQVEGVRKFESPRDVPHANRFRAELSRDRTITRFTEFAPLKWSRNSGPLSCEFLSREFHCTSGAREPGTPSDLRIPMKRPFGLLWPVSPFSLSSLTRESERDTSHPTDVQLLSIEQPSRAVPVSPTVLSGQLQYLGEEEIEAAGLKWKAHKFSLKAAAHPQYMIWTSSRGLLLALAIEHAHANWPEEGMKLARYKEWAEF
jgi:hypothetical protein